MGLNVDKLIASADARAHRRSTHMCLAYVRMALETVGAANSERASTAIGSVEYFRQNPNFVEQTATRENLKNFPKGTIIITRNPRGGAGHAEIARGDGTAVSDFDQNGMVVYRNATEFYAFVPRDAAHSGAQAVNYSLKEAKAHAGVSENVAYSTSGGLAALGLIFIFENAQKSVVEDVVSEMVDDPNASKPLEAAPLATATASLPSIDKSSAQVANRKIPYHTTRRKKMC